MRDDSDIEGVTNEKLHHDAGSDEGRLLQGPPL